MMHTILTTAIGSITSLIIGYLIKSLSNYKKRDDVQSKALRNILKGNLVNQFYVYKKIGSVPRYVKEAWYDMFESYTELNGNSYVKHSIEPEFAKLEIVDNEWYNISRVSGCRNHPLHNTYYGGVEWKLKLVRFVT